MVPALNPEEAGDMNPDLVWHKKLAANLFNSVWEILDDEDRSDYDVTRMIHMAHASVYHWSYAGEAVNMARGEWQVSRVYAVAGLPESALYHARLSLAICEHAGLGDFDLAFAHEAMARALKLSGSREEAAQYIQSAEEAAHQIRDHDDRQYFLCQLHTI